MRGNGGPGGGVRAGHGPERGAGGGRGGRPCLLLPRQGQSRSRSAGHGWERGRGDITEASLACGISGCWGGSPGYPGPGGSPVPRGRRGVNGAEVGAPNPAPVGTKSRGGGARGHPPPGTYSAVTDVPVTFIPRCQSDRTSILAPPQPRARSSQRGTAPTLGPPLPRHPTPPSRPRTRSRPVSPGMPDRVPGRRRVSGAAGAAVTAARGFGVKPVAASRDLRRLQRCFGISHPETLQKQPHRHRPCRGASHGKPGPNQHRVP